MGHGHIEGNDFLFVDFCHWDNRVGTFNEDGCIVDTTLGFRDGDIMNRLGECPIVVIPNPRFQFRDLEFMMHKVNFNVILDFFGGKRYFRCMLGLKMRQANSYCSFMRCSFFAIVEKRGISLL